MLKKIYFGDKPLFFSESKTSEELKPYLSDRGTTIIKDLNKDQLLSLITKMQETKTTAGVILYDVPEAFEALKKEFTLIQASGGMVYNGNKILLIFRRGKWDLPKGKLDEGEDLVQCALREVREETGLSELLFEQTLCITHHTYYEKGKHILKESHWHLLKGNDNEHLIPQTDEDIEKCEWVNTDNLSTYTKNAPASVIDVLRRGLSALEEKKNFD